MHFFRCWARMLNMIPGFLYFFNKTWTQQKSLCIVYPFASSLCEWEPPDTKTWRTRKRTNACLVSFIMRGMTEKKWIPVYILTPIFFVWFNAKLKSTEQPYYYYIHYITLGNCPSCSQLIPIFYSWKMLDAHTHRKCICICKKSS